MPELDAPQALTGVVLAAQANFYRVHLDPGLTPPQPRIEGSPEQLLCTRRSRLKKIGQQVVVGDRVTLHRAGERGVIEAVRERRNFLHRPPIANIDQTLIVLSMREPALDPVQLSRFLVHAEGCGIPVQVCLNKCDLISGPERDVWHRRLQSWGYDPLLLSATAGMGLSELRQVCRGQISVVMGLSGVGKSTLLNQLLPDLSLSTQAVSGRLRQGRHTTRHVELFPLGSDQGCGWIADSPGFNQADLSSCHAHTLIDQFPEVRHLIGHCQFRDCLHHQEPGCQIRTLSWERYPIYLSFLEEILSREGSDQVSPVPEESLKYKPSPKGAKRTSLNWQQAAIPRLHSRYRQRSRRQARQDSDRWTGHATEVLTDLEDNPVLE